MSKAKKGSKENPITSQDLENIANKVLGIDFEKRDYSITEAAIKDDFCNYSFEVVKGIGIGDKASIKGKAGTIKESLRKAFTKFNVHLAFMDDVFKNSNIEIEDIDKLHDDEHTSLYSVTGFKINGGDENESIILVGNKYISSGGRITLETPKIFIHEHSGYKWYNELKQAADIARNEVAKYKEGNYIPVVEDEDAVDPAQLTMCFSAEETEDDLSDFKMAAVK
ncbi:MAG TPA: hypothetical protein VN722_12115 [Hanamia sp.]|nr:hypothetical protein [Hanamia sp.]